MASYCASKFLQNGRFPRAFVRTTRGWRQHSPGVVCTIRGALQTWAPIIGQNFRHFRTVWRQTYSSTAPDFAKNATSWPSRLWRSASYSANPRTDGRPRLEGALTGPDRTNNSAHLSSLTVAISQLFGRIFASDIVSVRAPPQPVRGGDGRYP